VKASPTSGVLRQMPAMQKIGSSFFVNSHYVGRSLGEPDFDLEVCEVLKDRCRFHLQSIIVAHAAHHSCGGTGLSPVGERGRQTRVKRRRFTISERPEFFQVRRCFLQDDREARVTYRLCGAIRATKLGNLDAGLASRNFCVAPIAG